MRLQTKQKQHLLSWIAEGIESDEMNARAAECNPPFVVSRSQVQFYRDRHAVSLAALQREGANAALTTGLAVRANRVEKLQELATLLEEDIFHDRLWLDQVKMIGSGLFSRQVDYEEFNTAEVTQYRGVLDDIAKEVGDRKQASTVLNVTPEQIAKMSVDELEALAKKRGLV